MELAITLPVLLLLISGALDLGRAYFMTFNMNNAAKEGAFYGARNPTCDSDAGGGCGDPLNVHWRVEQELDGVALVDFSAKCFAPGTTDFSGPGKALSVCADGDFYHVQISADFNLVTPIVGGLLGSPVPLSASATSVVLTGFASSGGGVFPTFQATPSQPPGQCTVPDFRNGTKISEAQEVWTNVAGFLTAATTSGPSGQQISWQSLPFGTQGSCSTTTIVVSNTVQSTPSPSPSPTPTPTPSSTPSSTSTASATPTPTPAPTPSTCTVPQLVRSPKISVTQAQAVWTNAGFSAANFSAARPPNNDYGVASQNLAAGLIRPCLTTTIQVDN